MKKFFKINRAPVILALIFLLFLNVSASEIDSSQLAEDKHFSTDEVEEPITKKSPFALAIMILLILLFLRSKLGRIMLFNIMLGNIAVGRTSGWGSSGSSFGGGFGGFGSGS